MISNKFNEIEYLLPKGKDMTPYYEDIFNRAIECDTVVEFGINIGNSTKAIICGCPKKYIGYDPKPLLQNSNSFINGVTLPAYAKELGVEFIVEMKSSHDADFQEADMLFIDSVHTYSFLSRELNLHAHKIKKYIGMHDTVLCARTSAIQVGDGDSEKGLMDAIEEFLDMNNDWEIEKHNKDGIWGCLWLKRKSI